MTAAYPGPAYTIHTTRLVIRCWDPADSSSFKLSVDENLDHLRTFMPWAANYPQDLQVMVERLRGNRGRFDLGQEYVYGIFSKDGSRVLGGAGLHPRAGPNALEIGYWIHKDYINQGLATEVSAALTRVAFEVHEVERVEIHCAEENLASAAVPRKLGFTHEATLRHRTLLLDGISHNMMIWTLLRDEYPGSASEKAPITAYDALGRKILG